MGKPTHLVPLHQLAASISSINCRFDERALRKRHGKCLPNKFTFIVERQLIIPKMRANLKHISLLIPKFRLFAH
jgi:hypothetical protein